MSATAVEEKDQGDVVTPWEVHTSSTSGIDYDKLIVRFGSSHVTPELCLRFQEVTEKPIHHLLKRGVFFSHRELDDVLNCYQKGTPFYLYTGRGPSSEAMHVGHLIPFIFTKWLQDTFDVPLVIQLTDDEKYLWKNLTLQEARHLAHENAKDIIALGFNPDKTLIMNDLDFISQCPVFYYTIVALQRCITYNQAKCVVQPLLTESDSIARISYPPVKFAGSLSCALLPLLPTTARNHVRRSLIVCPTDDPNWACYTCLLRPCVNDPRQKPALLGFKSLPGLQSVQSKMDPREVNSAIHLKDLPKDIKNKINKYAFSGGGVSQEEHMKNGGNCDVDVSIHLLRYLLEDDQRLQTIEQDYSSGKLLTGYLKKELIDYLCALFTEINTRRSKLDDQVISKYCSIPSDFDVNYTMDELLKANASVGDSALLQGSTTPLPDLIKQFSSEFDVASHPLFRRKGLLMDHRDFDEILQLVKDGKSSEFYLFYSHCPTSESLHLGEIVPLLFVKWLQKHFGGVQVVIHITDDEHYIQQNVDIEAGTLEESKRIAFENKKDIIALGFEPENTLIFSSFEIMTPFYENICRVQRRVTYNQVKGIFGFTENDWIGKIGFPAVQASPSFSSGYPEIFHTNAKFTNDSSAAASSETTLPIEDANSKKKKNSKKTKNAPPVVAANQATAKSNVVCLIPCAIDQDPYFRMTRDVAPRLGLKKPALLHSTFFPALQGGQTKMSASEPNSAIFVTDKPDVILEKVRDHTYCDPDSSHNDVCFQYLRYFHPSEEKLQALELMFSNGTVDTTLLKDDLVKCLLELLTEIQLRRRDVTDSDLKKFILRHEFNFA